MEVAELLMMWKKILLSVMLGGFVLLVGYMYSLFVLKPNRLRRRLQRQGIRGPTPSFLVGNIPEMKRIQLQLHSKQQHQHDAKLAAPKQHHHQDQHGVALSHDWPSFVFPYFDQWRKEYGPVFMYSTGNIQIIFISDPEIVKEMSLCMSLGLGKPSFLTKDRARGPLFGQGVISSSGPSWAHQRKIISPEFYLDKVKGMVSLMVDSTNSLLRSWEQRIDNESGIADIRVDDDLRNLSGDIISRACFGSSSHSQGKEIFLMLRTLQGILSKSSLFIGIPGLRHVPSKNNREIWRLEKKIHSMILKVVDQRTEAMHEKDLLQMILEAAKNYVGDSDTMASDMIKRDKFIVDNCKNIYFAGHETTATTATWTLLLLAAHPDWQARARAEVQEIFGDGRLPDADKLRSMKILTMVIQETLRLYPPSSFVVREAYQDLKFKDLLLPKGINVSVPIPIMHQNPDLWGADVQKFNPERFAGGILGACKSPQAYIPFGMGARICLGQHFGMVELKAVLSLILSKFCFTVSPTYRHSPAFKLVMEPGEGVNLLVKRL